MYSRNSSLCFAPPCEDKNYGSAQYMTWMNVGGMNTVENPISYNEKWRLQGWQRSQIFLCKHKLNMFKLRHPNITILVIAIRKYNVMNSKV